MKEYRWKKYTTLRGSESHGELGKAERNLRKSRSEGRRRGMRRRSEGKKNIMRRRMIFAKISYPPLLPPPTALPLLHKCVLFCFYLPFLLSSYPPSLSCSPLRFLIPAVLCCCCWQHLRARRSQASSPPSKLERRGEERRGEERRGEERRGEERRGEERRGEERERRGEERERRGEERRGEGKEKRGEERR
eukprot:765079-Hanusia_phi.AAC.1